MSLLKLQHLRQLSIVNRSLSTTNDEIKPRLTNRNPRNLERLRIAYKPDGYHLEKPGRSFWHKLRLTVTQKHVTASVDHYLNGEVLTASTKEWAIKKQLYRTTDTSAYINLGRVLAHRCLQSGLTEVRCNITANLDGKVSEFLKSIQNGGVSLTEPPQYKPSRPWDQHRPEKPWEIE